ncbi:hypothetical protein V1478_017991 [Vespula squamosa]|uniref:Uncharacterized protein n=1 Tax=Vespula squamosa TaxID=30214 RepID=A0ABD1ZVS9_VESSQ
MSLTLRNGNNGLNFERSNTRSKRSEMKACQPRIREKRDDEVDPEDDHKRSVNGCLVGEERCIDRRDTSVKLTTNTTRRKFRCRVLTKFVTCCRRRGRSYLLQQQQPVAMHRRIIYLCVTASVGTGNFPSDKERLRKLQLKQGEKGTDSNSSSSVVVVIVIIIAVVVVAVVIVM